MTVFKTPAQEQVYAQLAESQKPVYAESTKSYYELRDKIDALSRQPETSHRNAEIYKLSGQVDAYEKILYDLEHGKSYDLSSVKDYAAQRGTFQAESAMAYKPATAYRPTEVYRTPKTEYSYYVDAKTGQAYSAASPRSPSDVGYSSAYFAPPISVSPIGRPTTLPPLLQQRTPREQLLSPQQYTQPTLVQQRTVTPTSAYQRFSEQSKTENPIRVFKETYAGEAFRYLEKEERQNAPLGQSFFGTPEVRSAITTGLYFVPYIGVGLLAAEGAAGFATKGGRTEMAQGKYYSGYIFNTLSLFGGGTALAKITEKAAGYPTYQTRVLQTVKNVQPETDLITGLNKFRVESEFNVATKRTGLFSTQVSIAAGKSETLATPITEGIFKFESASAGRFREIGSTQQGTQFASIAKGLLKEQPVALTQDVQGTKVSKIMEQGFKFAGRTESTSEKTGIKKILDRDVSTQSEFFGYGFTDKEITRSVATSQPYRLSSFSDRYVPTKYGRGITVSKVKEEIPTTEWFFGGQGTVKDNRMISKILKTQEASIASAVQSTYQKSTTTELLFGGKPKPVTKLAQAQKVKETKISYGIVPQQNLEAQVQKVKERQSVSPTMLSKESAAVLTSYKQGSTFGIVTKEQIKTTDKPKELTRQIFGFGTAQPQRQIQREKQVPKQRYDYGFGTFIPTETTTGKLGLFNLSKDEREVSKKKKIFGFIAEVKRRGKFYQVSKPTTKEQAISIGAGIADVTLGRTFRVRQTKQTINAPTQRFGMPENIYKFRGFRISKGQQIPLQDTFIERSKFTLESQEQKQIQVARKKKGRVGGFFGI